MLKRFITCLLCAKHGSKMYFRSFNPFNVHKVLRLSTPITPYFMAKKKN